MNKPTDMEAGKKRILIAEHDPDMLFILHEVLRKAGYAVESSKGTSIVESRHEWPDLFIVDKDLKSMDGMEVCKILKVREETKRIPIIMLSSYEVRKRAARAGVEEFMRKPFQVKTLLQTVKKHLQ